ncbi:hypothetical protein [Leucobacter chromiisoli]|nr:hypothetical protein [Leucobacter chromiisoli]
MSGKERGYKSAKKPAKMSLKEKRAAKREKAEAESTLLNRRS